ncbi:MAG: tripartite tricarboxylate transporter substrate-binding protein [Alphaproteobacteria bacterium]|nr:tripartite tricarboxylate transporter substrate-binding protein [Alphaproteobacteria bacterium]
MTSLATSRLNRFGALAVALTVLLPLGQAQAEVGDFYKGKTIKLVIASGEGGGVDLLGRAVARHLGKHIRGNPSFIVNNIPQPSAIGGASFVYNVAKPDGLTIGGASAGLFSRAVTRPNIKFKLDRFTWLGNLYKATVLFWMRTDFPCQTLEALKTCPQRLKFGGTSRGSTGYGLVPALIKDALGLNMDMIVGYKNTAIVLALEQGEIDASGGDIIGFFGGRPYALMKEGKVKILAQVAGSKADELKPFNVPWIMDVVPASHKPLFEMVNPWIDMARPYFAPPGVPADRAKHLQDAFKKLAKDQAFTGEVKKAARIDITLVPGDEMLTKIQAMLKLPPEVKEKITNLVRKKKRKKK